jgi:hypothetical protein
MIVMQHIERLNCIRMLFCVNKSFNFFCRQRIVSLKIDIEARIRDEIQFVLKLDMPGIDSSLQLKVNEIMWGFLRTALGRERVFHKTMQTRKQLNALSAEIRSPVVKLEQLLVRVQVQQKRLQDVIDKNNALPGTVSQSGNGKCKKFGIADILMKDVDDLHNTIKNETSNLLSEAKSLMPIVKFQKQSVKVEMQLLRLQSLIDKSNPKMQAPPDQVAARGSRSSTRKARVDEFQQEDVLSVVDMHKKMIGQTLTLQEEAKDLLVAARERLTDVKASSQGCKSLLLKLNRSARQGFSQLEKQIRSCWARLVNVGNREWMTGRRSSMRRIHAALADRLRMGARTRTKVDRPALGEQGGGCAVSVSFAEEFEGA